MSLRVGVARALGEPEGVLDEAVWERLERLDALLSTWNRRVDLHGFRGERERASRYYAEPIAARERVPESGRAVEIGSGGGSPGLPLAIVRPGVRWWLVEASSRKALFLDEATRALALSNVEVVEARYESWSPPEGMDRVLVRGVAPGALGGKIASDLAPSGRLLWFTSSRAAAGGLAGFRRAVALPSAPLVTGGATLWEGVPDPRAVDVSRETSD